MFDGALDKSCCPQPVCFLFTGSYLDQKQCWEEGGRSLAIGTYVFETSVKDYILNSHDGVRSPRTRQFRRICGGDQTQPKTAEELVLRAWYVCVCVYNVCVCELGCSIKPLVNSANFPPPPPNIFLCWSITRRILLVRVQNRGHRPVTFPPVCEVALSRD